MASSMVVVEDDDPLTAFSKQQQQQQQPQAEATAVTALGGGEQNTTGISTDQKKEEDDEGNKEQKMTTIPLSNDENLTAAELRAKYRIGGGARKTSSPSGDADDLAAAAAVSETQATAWRAAVYKVLNQDARRRNGRGASTEVVLSKKAVRRLVEKQLGLDAKSLDPHRKEINRLIEEFRDRIFIACSEGNVAEVESLVRARASVNFKNSRGTVPLHLATTKGHDEVVGRLLAARALPDVRMSNGWTPLLYASWKGQQKIVSGLINARAQLNIKTQDGAVALTWAAREGHIEIIKSLAEAKADPMARDYMQKMTPRQHAERQKKTEAAKLLARLEEQRAEEKKMAEFRARLQYPEGFEESESEANRPSRKSDSEGGGERAKSGASPSSSTRDSGNVVAIDIHGTGGAAGGRRIVKGLSPAVVAAVSTAAPLRLLAQDMAKLGSYVRKSFLIEAILTVAVFVLLKGLLGVRCGGRLTLEQVEIWLLADLLYV
eukprot:jgi/Bigna1/69600/fgenesh1_pg.9_\